MERAEFMKKLENHDVDEADTATLECQLSKSDKTVQWVKNEEPVVQDGRITATVDTYKHQLIIRDVTLEDAGNVSCVYGNVRTDCILRVQEVPIAFTETLKDQTALEGVDVTLGCRLSKPYKKVQWLTNSYLVPPYDRITIIADKFFHRLIIRDVTPSVSGEYRCVCDNARTRCTLKVASEELAPGFTKALENKTAMGAETVTLDCQLSKPYQTVKWMKNEESVVQDGRITVIADVHRHKLAIRNVALEDAGNFSCVYHSARTECTLQVEELEPEFTRALENQTVYSTMTVTFECRLSKPNKTVHWVHNGQQICLDDRISATLAIYTHRLIIKAAKTEDAGTFRCVCGNVSTQSTLTVEELPVENDWFDGERYCNWVKTSVSLCYMKEGITEFSNTKAASFHKYIKGRVSLRKYQASSTTCTQCTHKQARTTKGKDKNTTTWRMNCSMNICNVWLEEILPYHRHVALCPNIEWKNSDPRLWPSDSWELVKLFQPFGCKVHHRAENSDATGLLTLILDCSFFSQFLSNLQILQEIKDVRNVCMHSKDLLLKDGDMEQSLDLMVTFLGETELQKYQTAREAADKITQLRYKRLDLSLKKSLEEKVLKDKLTEVKHNITKLDDTDNNLRGLTGSMSVQQNTYLGDYRKRLKEFQDLFSEVETALQNIIQEKAHDIKKTFTKVMFLINRLQDVEQDNREVDEFYQPNIYTLESEQQDVTSDSQEQTGQPGERQLRVTAPASYFSKELRNQAVYEKATVTLECELSQPNQTVRWLKGVTQVCSSNHITVEADTYIHRLTIRNVTLEDAGTFRCFCDNVSSFCNFVVNELEPDFVKKLENHTVIETLTVTLACQLSKPNKAVKWLKDGRQVIPDHRITIISDDFTHKLTIRDLTLEDAGNFRCVSGDVSTHCTLAVNELPVKFVKPLENRNAYTKSSVSTTLSCELDRPNKTVTWTKNGRAVSSNVNLKIVSGIYTHQLVFSELTRSETGQYTCSYRDVETTAGLTVYDNGDQASRELRFHDGKAKDIQKRVRKKRSLMQKLTLQRVDLSSLGDQLSGVLTLQHLVKLTLGDSWSEITLSHEQCENLGRDLRGSPQLRELTLQYISCTTHGKKSGCGELDVGGPLRLHGIKLELLPFTRVVFNPELLLRCNIDLDDNVACQVSTLQSLLAARNLQEFMCWNVNDAAAASKLADVLPQLHGLQQLDLWHIDFGSVTDIRLSATMNQLESVFLYKCKFVPVGLECLLQQHNLPQRRVMITLRDVTVRGEEDVISKIRRSPNTEVRNDIDVKYRGDEWKVGCFIFYTRK